MLLLYDMNGKLPIKLLYKTSDCLSVNAPNQKTLAMDLSKLLRMTFGARTQWASLIFGKSTIDRIIGTPGTGGMSGISISRTTCAGTIVLGVLLLMPGQSCFMCPFAVVGLGLRYRKINFLDIFGHPLRYPMCMALSNVEIGGLHSAWWANFTPLAHVRTECVNNARSTPLCNVSLRCKAQSGIGAGSGWAECIPSGVIGSVHKSVDEFSNPRNITCLLYWTLHLLLSNFTRHPALQSGKILTRDAIAKYRTMCLVRTVGRPGMLLLNMCNDVSRCPSGRLIISGFVAGHLLKMSTPSVMKIDVAPVSSMALLAAINGESVQRLM
jgi:hypothetical protein